MFNNKNRALYKIGKMFYLDKIKKKDLMNYILNRFKEDDYIISKEIAERICRIAEDHIYYVQMLCHEVWEISSENKLINDKILNKAIDRTILNQSELYLKIWENLSVYQKYFLTSLVKSGGEFVLSNKYRNENNLPGASTVRKNAITLMEKGIIEKNKRIYNITDVFFGLWLKRYML